MGSRRTMTRSQSNGRVQNGTEVSGSGRSPGCSYLSNVRPENRSTLCSVIALLTEETQPFFEITLKSKAVSENCNVKFSCVVTGHPTPQVTWYKDDTQLDRYCGLPKYEIFRKGQNHSLHIYNCTVDDAAIYQASATNTKGIVSCSGVLEVGEMNEFKIHQRYFSKLKLKAENKRREVEEKENQEPVRTISPDRAQRKRRSTVGGYISAPSSTEEDVCEESQLEVAAEVRPRIQETTVEEVKDTKGTESLNGQDTKENCPKTGTHIYDSAQKIFTALQPKSPFFKKIKVSNTAKVASKGQKSSVAGAESPESQKYSEGFMDVEISNTITSAPAALKSLKRVTNIGGKQASQEKNDRKAVKEKVKAQNGSLSITSSPPIPPRASKQQQPQINKDTSLPPYTKVTHRDEKLGLSTDVTPDTNETCDSRAAPTQPPRQRVRDQLPRKDTRPDQKSVCVPEPVLPREATQAHAKTLRNDAPVDLELQSKLHTTMAPEKTPAERVKLDRPGPSLHHSLQKAINKTTQDTQTHSRGLSKSSTALFADTQKPPLESPGAGEKSPECNVSPTAQQSQLNTPIKTVEGTEIQLDEKVKDNKMGPLIAQSISVAPKEESEMVMVEEKAEEVHGMTVETSNEERKSKSPVEIMEMQPQEIAPITKDAKLFSEPELNNFQKSPSPIPSIISIAELLRSQINALEKSVPTRLASMESKEDCGSSTVKKTNKDSSTEKSPPQTIKETLMQIYNELIRTKELFEDEVPVLSNCAQTHKLPETPPFISGTPESATFSKEINGLTPSKTVPEAVSGTPLKVSDQKPPKDKPVQGSDIVKNKQTPEIKLNSETVVEVCEAIKTPLVDLKTHEFKPQINGLEAELPVASVLDCVAQVSNPQKESTKTEDTVTPPPLPNVSPESSPLLKKRDSVSIPSATPQELASGARRKILTQKTKQEEMEPSTPADLNPVPVIVSTSPRLSRHSALLQPEVEQSSPKKKRSPLLSRKKSPLEVPSPHTHELPEKPEKEKEKPADKAKNDPFKAPQVIRKIRGETFTDHSGHLKLWCQFFNVLSESTVIWYRDESAIAKLLKRAGDETQVNLALAQASCIDAGVYGCTITNEYGTDSTDFLLSGEVLTGMSLQEDLGVGEEIEMTPLIFNKGIADSAWGNKLFGRIMLQETHLGVGLSHKTWRAKVIYGLEPLFESGNTCIIKVCNPIAYGGKGEGLLIEKNQEIVKQACKIQNLAREYCKIFTAEAKVIENFGSSLEVVPVYQMYRPANSIPYATVEADLTGVYNTYSALDYTGRLEMKSGSEVEQKCCALQHWVFQWTSGNMLFTKLEGVDTKITNVSISVKFTGHQGLSLEGNPKVFGQFILQHQCNYFCGLLGLRSLKAIESLLMPAKPKSSKSPLVQRKMASSSSPQTGRKTSASPRMPRKMEQDGRKSPSVQKADESRDTLTNNV